MKIHGVGSAEMNPPSGEARARMDAYEKRVRRCFDELSRYVPDEPLGLAGELLESGEPAEGLVQLAWIADRSGAAVSQDLIGEVLVLTSDLVEDQYLPPSFKDPDIR